MIEILRKPSHTHMGTLSRKTQKIRFLEIYLNIIAHEYFDNGYIIFSLGI